jgi:quercetin dioxygenase-like cupin family protein
MRTIAFCAVLLAGLAAAAFASAREDEDQGGVTSKVLLDDILAREPGKMVNAQLYTFPPGAVLPWHIHPDAHEIAFVVEGDFTFQIEGEPLKELKQGEAFYMRPNAVHRGMNKTDRPVKLFVVRIKPKDMPLMVEVPTPPQ